MNRISMKWKLLLFAIIFVVLVFGFPAIAGEPITFVLSNSTVEETAASGTQIGGFQLSSDTQNPVYSLPSGQGDNIYFSISGTSLYTAAEFDFEQVTTYSVVVDAVGDDDSSGQETLSIKILDMPPIVQDSSFSIPEDAGSGSVGYLSLSGDVTSVEFHISEEPTKGSVSLDVDGSYEYIPNADENGADSFAFYATDGTNYTYGTVNVTITPENDYPVIQQGDTASITCIEDGDEEQLSLSAIDADNDTLTFSISSQSSHGLAVVDANTETVCYTPTEPDYFGDDSFVVTVSDGNGGTDSITVNVTITAVNDPPSFTSGSDQIVAEDCGAQTIENWATDISAGAANEGSQTLTFSIDGITNAALFSAEPTVSSDGTLRFLPAGNANGWATFNISLSDGDGGNSSEYTITITVNPVNDAPVNTAVPLITGTAHNGETLRVSTGSWNDAADGADASSLTYSYQWQSAASLQGDYTNIALANTDEFELTSEQNDLFIRVMVTCMETGAEPLSAIAYSDSIEIENQAPLIDRGGNADIVMLEDGDEEAVSLLAVDADGDTMTWAITQQASKGNAVVTTDDGTECQISYTPAADENGDDSFVVTVSDGNGGTDSITVNVTITAVNDPPSFTSGSDQIVAEDCGAQTIENWATDISAGAANEGSQTLTFSIDGITNAALFSAEPTVSSDGTLRFLPADNANGWATFNISLSDGDGENSGEYTITITVNPVNDVPVNTSVPMISGTPHTGQTLSVSAGGWNDDADGALAATLIYTYQWQSANSTSGPWSDIDDAQSDSLSLTSSQENLYIRVKETCTEDAAEPLYAVVYSDSVLVINNAPVIDQGDTADANVIEDEDHTIITLTATDVDDDSLTWEITTQGTKGSAAVVVDNGTQCDIYYWPDADEFGTDSFIATVSDGYGATAEITVNIAIHEVNDPPEFVIDGDQEVAEDCGSQSVDDWVTYMSAGAANESDQTLFFTIDDNSNETLFSVLPAVSDTGVLSYTPAENASGSAMIWLHISDSDGESSDPQSFTITVNPVNDPPVNTELPSAEGTFAVGGGISANSGTWDDSADSNIVMAEDISFIWQTASDTSGSDLLQAGTGSAYEVLLSDTHRLIRVIAEVTDTDDAGTVTAQAYSQWYLIANTPPVIEDLAPAIITNEDTNGTVSLSATDADLDTLAWSITKQASHGAASINAATGAVTYTPDANYNGDDSFAVSVSDGYEGTDSVTVGVTVNAVNDVPVFTIGADQTVNEDSGTQTVDPFIQSMSAGPSDESAQTLTFTVTNNSNPALFSAVPFVSSAGVLTYTPAADAFGLAEITVSISDSAGATNGSTQSFTITINNINDAPRNTGAPVITGTVHNGQILTVSTGEWSDAADDTNATELSYTYQWQSASSESGPWNNISGATGAQYTLTSAENDLYIRAVVTCSDSDSEPASASEVSQTVLVTNEAPILTSEDSPIMLFSEDGDAQSFTTEATDADGDALTWEVTEASIGTATVVGGVVNYQPNANANGEDEFTITVFDGNGGFDSMLFTVLIDAVNDIPTFTIGADQVDTEDGGGQYESGWIQTMSPGPLDESGQTLSFTVSDITNETLFTQLPHVTNEGTLYYVLAGNQNGSTQVSVSISDSEGATNPAKQTFTITVNAVNDTPVLVTDPAITGTFAAGYTLTSGSGVWSDAIDEDAGTIVYDYTWYFADDDQGTNAISEAGTNEYLLTSTQSHKYVRALVSVINEDTTGTTETQAYTPWYLVQNTAPVITEADPAVTTDEDIAYSLTLHATDVDDDTLTWSISSAAQHGTVEVNTATGYITYTPSLNYRGEDTFTVQVADAFGGVDDVTIPVTVNAVNDVPINTVPPSVSGAHAYGNTMTASEGTWTDDADDNLVTLTYSYQWQRASDDQGSELANISTGSTYVLTDADSHQYIRVLVTVTDTDASGTLQPQATSVWTYVDNTNPEITENLPSITTDEDTEDTLTLHATDVDADTLTWSVSAQGTRGLAEIDENTGLITYTPSTDDNGSDSFEITVADGHGGTDTVFVLVTINAVNDVPSFTVGENQSVLEDCGTQTVTGWISTMSKGPDNESDQTLAYTVSITEETVTDSLSLFASTPTVSPDGTLVFTPNENAYGLATLSVFVQDSGGGEHDTSAAQTFTITVTPVNDAPVITGLAAVETQEDVAYVYAFTLQDVEGNLDSLNVAFTSDNTALLENGSMELGGSGASRTLTLSPEEDRSGTVNITFVITDTQGGKVTKTVTLTVTAVNDAPTISEIADRTTYEDTSTGAIGFTISDVDTTISSCTVTAVSANTTLVPNDETYITVGGTSANRTVTILPAQDEYGTAVITLTVSDGSLTAESTFTLTVDPVNDKPTISEVSDVTINEDSNTGAIEFTVADIDHPLSQLTISAAANNTALVPKSSIVVSDIDNDGKATVTVTPVANYNGTSTITLTVKDLNGALSTESFLLTVDPVNDPPTMSTIANQSINEDNTRSFSVYVSDIDTSTSALTVTAIESTNTELLPLDAEHISITGSTGTRTVSLTPATNQNGTTYVTLQVSDGGETIATRQFLFTVNAVNDTPYFTAGTDIVISEDSGAQSFTNWATDISTGADNETEALTFNVQADIASMFSEQPAIDENGTLTFTPASNANGTGIITVSLSDADGETSESIQFTIVISSVNDVPIAYDMTTGLDTDEDQQLKGSLIIYDPDTNPITFELVSGEDHNVTTLTTASGGTVTLDSSAGTFIYVPYQDYYEGADSFSFRVFDGTVYSNEAEVIINLTGINDPPVAQDGTLSVDEDAQNIAGSLSGLVTDVDNATLVYSIVNTPNQGGTVTLDADTGAYTYSAPANYFGTERFTFRVYDGATYSNTATITVSIASVNDAPVAQDETINLDEGKTVNSTFKATDVELDAIAFSIVTPPSSGTLTLLDASTGAYTYTPADMTTEATVTVTAVFEAEDPSGGSSTGTVTIVVRNVNDAPCLEDETQLTVTTAEDTAVNSSIAAVDIDGDALLYTILNDVNHGSISGFDSATGNYTYTPNGNYYGTDYFTFIATEDRAENALSTGIYRVSITVTPVNDNPTAYTLYYYTDEETAITLSPVGYDPEGNSMTYVIDSTPLYGSISTTDNISFTYTPNVGNTGVTDAILYHATGQPGWCIRYRYDVCAHLRRWQRGRFERL